MTYIVGTRSVAECLARGLDMAFGSGHPVRFEARPYGNTDDGWGVVEIERDYGRDGEERPLGHVWNARDLLFDRQAENDGAVAVRRRRAHVARLAAAEMDMHGELRLARTHVADLEDA